MSLEALSLYRELTTKCLYDSYSHARPINPYENTRPICIIGKPIRTRVCEQHLLRVIRTHTFAISSYDNACVNNDITDS